MPLDGHIFLQPLDARHLASIHRLHQDPITQQYAWIDGLETEEANARWMSSEIDKGILGFKALILKENDKFVGLAGLRMRTDLGEDRYSVSYFTRTKKSRLCDPSSGIAYKYSQKRTET